MESPAYDLILRGGTVIDGTGAARYAADVGIRGERIAAVGDLAGERAASTVDVAGKIVAPGFIDTHTHDDCACLTAPDMVPKISQGVTTVVVGNCGLSVAPIRFPRSVPEPFNLLGQAKDFVFDRFADYADAVDAAQPRVNVAALVGHSTLRAACVRDLSRKANAVELTTMRAYVAEAMAAGAHGMSSGVFYPPAAAADIDELVAVAREVGAAGGVYATHIRDEYDGVIEALREAFATAAQAVVPLVVSHHKCAGVHNWGRSVHTLALLEETARRQPVGLDCYPYTAGSSVLEPDLADGEIDILINSSKPHPECAGRYLREISASWGVSQREAAERLVPGSACYFQIHEDDMRRILQHPLSMVGSDGLPNDPNPHPRLWGTFPRVLGKYAREQGLFPLETAVHKMTGLSAMRFGLAGRGRVAVGHAADLTIFDADTVLDRATFEQPRQTAAGIEHVYVNGQLAWRGGEPAGTRSGRFLRRGLA